MPESSFSSTYQTLPASIKNVINLVVQQINPDEVILFGSRARGNHRETSDFDIAVKSSTLPSANWTRLLLAIDEEPLTLYHVDLVDFNQVGDDYQKRISSEGKILYAR